MTMPRFHLAIPVDDLEAGRAFYGDLLGCPQGREDPGHWIDFDLRGHQLVLHKGEGAGVRLRNAVDGDAVPVPHFGLVLDWDEWHALADRVKAAGTEFVIEPHIRFAGLPGEQATMFFFDPAGNALEFKAFKDIGQLFAV
ncbi:MULTISPECIES: VOC family protein [unclassified Sphingomonas]|uniref:VOC family protein n=1 Tax=unclassified Sphingomonas TaxID=196159 RepID=UPI00082F5912|nr:MULTISPECIES: VOC family protein [unclassified Sphingomonas]